MFGQVAGLRSSRVLVALTRSASSGEIWEVSGISTGPLRRHATPTVIKLRRSSSSGEIQI
jgi:hypothetical protein